MGSELGRTVWDLEHHASRLQRIGGQTSNQIRWTSLVRSLEEGSAGSAHSICEKPRGMKRLLHSTHLYIYEGQHNEAAHSKVRCSIDVRTRLYFSSWKLSHPTDRADRVESLSLEFNAVPSLQGPAVITRWEPAMCFSPTTMDCSATAYHLITRRSIIVVRS